MLADDWDTCVAMARDAVKGGAHVLDVCVDYTGEDGVSDMQEVASRFATQATLPIMLDSTEPPVIEAGLQLIAGKPILNSVNLEDGDAPGTRLDRFLAWPASTARRWCAPASTPRARPAPPSGSCGRPGPSTTWPSSATAWLPRTCSSIPWSCRISTGMEESRRDGIETIEGIRRIKAELPGVGTIVGLSNVSFGLTPAARHALNSVFLHECQEAGLDAAIVHAARIMPLHKIDPRVVEVCLDLIYDRRDAARATTRCSELLRSVRGGVVRRAGRPRTAAAGRSSAGWSSGSSTATATGWKPTWTRPSPTAGPPSTSSTAPCSAGMKVVGELFGSGQMQLPFVLQSAETMKTRGRLPRAAHGEGRRRRQGPHRARHGQGRRARHRQEPGRHHLHQQRLRGAQPRHQGAPRPTCSTTAEEVGADAIGMSGLLVKSTLIMRENLLEMNERGLSDDPRHPRRGRPDPDLRRAGPALASTRAGCSTARTPSRGCTPWTG